MQPTGHQRVGVRAGRIEAVADQHQPVGRTARCDRHHPAIDVRPVADQVAAEPALDERHAGEARGAVVQRSHRIEEVRHVARTLRHRLRHDFRRREAVPQGRDHSTPRKAIQKLWRARKLGGECDHPNGAGGSRENFLALSGVETAHPPRGVRA
jgi:hypothetical protein